jgi:hypothetical protein
MAVSSEADPSPALTEHFADLDDPRRENSTDYPLHEIIVLTICVLTICVLTICGVICGADESGSIANFGEAKNWGGKELGRQRGSGWGSFWNWRTEFRRTTRLDGSRLGGSRLGSSLACSIQKRSRRGFRGAVFEVGARGL